MLNECRVRHPHRLIRSSSFQHAKQSTCWPAWLCLVANNCCHRLQLDIPNLRLLVPESLPPDAVLAEMQAVVDNLTRSGASLQFCGRLAVQNNNFVAA